MQNDMKSTIQAAVAEAVGKATGRQLELLGRQLELLEKIVQFLGIEPGPTRVASAPKGTPAHAPAPARKGPSSVPVRKWVRPQAAPKPAKAGPAPQKSRGRPRGAGRAATAAATDSSPGPETPVPYAEGQEVRYKQGRGAFTAKVKAVDEKAKTVTLARVSDGRKVVRPFDKVTPA
ncbi:PspA [Myxococcus llanfairpwllgwyngyllgogerychwyrndrobwllllantysiliogogogochensis]|uniref:PspA n=1 Tax=Myxococcus llanfairpwllgwyngyllgogerychwyrndrobwllllantysiliogogogochensis TaxID=2590453 RepID=A0A540WN55_9BACT|nr:PspA [Myxococcus llanfairpwllgwyngyllgogerychwyrndrobwllllantysiliogogogochensis]TQF10441.1 PspA [Myxococcus llanfairpwllgwyngyllgogerychwyrndrobwllllantysiliogogogochensis]